MVWETLPLTQSVMEDPDPGPCLGQSSSRDTKIRNVWKVLSRRPVQVIVLEDSWSGKTDDNGKIKQDAKVKKWFRTDPNLTEEETQVLQDARSWHRSWLEKRGGGSPRPRTSSDPTSWEGGGGSEWEDEDIPF